MEAVAVLIMLSHHLQGFYVISIISKCKIAMDILLLSYTETAVLKTVIWFIDSSCYCLSHATNNILRFTNAGRVTATVCGANYCRPVTVPSPMRDRSPQQELHPLLRTVCAVL